ncbi:MAG: GSCFA domain-containing protein [Lentisphaeraceae bacterium]|nr:GSCFA domain-containing protein [Lentisphaeraceae bacterium]
MKFRTELDVKKELNLLPTDGLVALGSCFADRLSSHFQNIGLDAEVNPFGVIYNPVSIAQLLSASLNQEEIGSWEKIDDLYVNTMWHGQFNTSSSEDSSEKVLSIQKSTRKKLTTAKTLVLTLGTSYAYIDKESKAVVTNCHRLPADRFERGLLNLSEMKESLRDVFRQLKSKNKNIQILLTVSPVRHVRDSLVQNQRSKSQLIGLVHDLVESQEGVFYFPSYEIMMDDLRDYRFYQDDLVQPSNQGVAYILEKFREFAYSNELLEYEKLALKLVQRLSHRPKNLTVGTEVFEQKNKTLLADFQAKYPFTSLK